MKVDLGAYFRTLTGERSVRAIAAHTELDQSTLNRQLARKSALTVETVVEICRAYSLDMGQVFVAVGFLTPDEARNFSSSYGLKDFTDRELLLEILRRTNEQQASDALTEPIADSDLAHVEREREAAGIVAPGAHSVRGPRQDDLALVADETPIPAHDLSDEHFDGA